MAESKEVIQYDKAELRAITGAFKAMDAEAIEQAKTQSGALASYLQGKIISAAGQLNSAPVATTQQLWGGSEFGSNKFKQFPIWSGSTGRGSTGYFIYPTLRAEQSYLITEWEKAFTDIVKRFD